MHLTEEQYQEIMARQQAKMAAMKKSDAAAMFKAKLNRACQKGLDVLAKKLKPSRNDPNKTERRFEREIIVPQNWTWYQFHPMTFLLVNPESKTKIRYTPDIVAWEDSDFCQNEGRLFCFEVKGGRWWEDAKIKFLFAREQYPWITWQAWQWKGGEWRELWTA